MRPYHVSFWSGARAHSVGCDLDPAADEVLDGFARAGSYALALRRQTLSVRETGDRGLTPVELGWLLFACGPAWLFVAASYWMG